MTAKASALRDRPRVDDPNVASGERGNFVIRWIAGAAIYALFAGAFRFHELAAMASGGLVFALWSASLRRTAAIRFRFQRENLAVAARAVGALPLATARVSLRLAQAVVGSGPASRCPGKSLSEPLARGRHYDPVDAARRATTVLARSLGPDSFVLRLPRRRDEIEVHHLLAAPASRAGR
jgi:hypothetical protein